MTLSEAALGSLLGLSLVLAQPNPGQDRPWPPPRPAVRPSEDSDAKREKRSMDATFEKALASEGQPYLEAENQLRSGGEPALATLKGRVQDPDPFTRFVAQTLLDWMEGRAPDNQKALDYLDTLPAKLRRTPITGPSPLGVASYLATHFEARVGNVLVLRLVKALDWPRWRILGVLFYLKDQKAPGATAGLIRFAAETKNDEYRAAAVDAIKAAGDPDVGAKILAEKNRLEKLNRQLHGSILSIESPG